MPFGTLDSFMHYLAVPTQHFKGHSVRASHSLNVLLRRFIWIHLVMMHRIHILKYVPARAHQGTDITISTIGRPHGKETMWRGGNNVPLTLGVLDRQESVGVDRSFLLSVSMATDCSLNCVLHIWVSSGKFSEDWGNRHCSWMYCLKSLHIRYCVCYA